MRVIFVFILFIWQRIFSGHADTALIYSPKIDQHIQIQLTNLTKQTILCQQLQYLRKSRCRILEEAVSKLQLTPNKKFQNINALSGIKSIFTDCHRIQRYKHLRSEVYPIWLNEGYRFIHIYCDMESGSYITNKTGWITFQQRKNGKINFNRGWEDYVNGFGNPNEDYWAGLENIRFLVTQNIIGKTYGYLLYRPNMRIDLVGWDKFYAFVQFEKFALFPKLSNYRMADLGSHHGNAVQPLISYDIFLGQEFSTFDNIDKTRHFNSNCPSPLKGGWWFSTCSFSNLNGIYAGAEDKMSIHNIYWRYWSYINENNTALKHVSMKIQF